MFIVPIAAEMDAIDTQAISLRGLLCSKNPDVFRVQTCC
jgi:hypothetical protein